MSISLKEIGEFLAAVINVGNGSSYSAHQAQILAPVCEKLGLISIKSAGNYGVGYEITSFGLDVKMDFYMGNGYEEFQKLANEVSAETLEELGGRFESVNIPPSYQKFFEKAGVLSL